MTTTAHGHQVSIVYHEKGVYLSLSVCVKDRLMDKNSMRKMKFTYFILFFEVLVEIVSLTPAFKAGQKVTRLRVGRRIGF